MISPRSVFHLIYGLEARLADSKGQQFEVEVSNL